VKFRVFKNGKIVDKFALCGAYLFGTDGIGIRRAKFTFKNSFLECEKPNLETAGLALLWPIEGFGKVLLPTTCLPEREKPYNLNVEIARAKLMQIINKREDWAFFDQLEGFEDISKQAQVLFTQAIQNIKNPPLASKLADESLKKAIVFSEDLAVKQAESLFGARSNTHGFGRGCLGCRIDPKQITNPEYVARLMELFGSVTIPINWAQIEPREDDDFTSIDVCIEALIKKKLTFSAGPLLCFSKEYLPRWLLSSKAGFEKIRDTAYQFASMVALRYSNIIRSWCVISGLNVFNHFGFDFEQVLEMTRAANMAIKAASSSRALKIIEISNPWGEYYATTPHTIPPLVYIDMLVQSGINFDAFGLQVKFGKNQSGMHVRDMLQISAVLDYFAPIARPLYITALEVPSQNGDGLHQPEVAGIWHQKWSQAKQAQWLEQFYKIALSKPFVETVTYSNIIDKADSTIAYSGLLTNQLEPKKSFNTLKKLRNSIFTR